MIVAMFRTYLKPQANLDELGVLHEKMHAIVTNMPGFISVKQAYRCLRLRMEIGRAHV